MPEVGWRPVQLKAGPPGLWPMATRGWAEIAVAIAQSDATGIGGRVVSHSTDETPRDHKRVPLAACFIIPLLACGLAGYYRGTTTDLVWEARAAEVVVGVPLIGMCVLHMGRTIYRIVQGSGSFSGGDMFANTLFNRQRLALVVLVSAFIIALPWTGATLGLFLVLVASMWTLGVTSIRTLVLVAGTTAATVYVLLMYLVSSRLPHGPIEWLITWAFGIGA